MHPYLYTPHELALQLAKRFKDECLNANFSQQTLSARSGVSLGVIKKFEQNGKIALEAMIKLAITLDLTPLFIMPEKLPQKSFITLDQLLAQKNRKRGRGRK